ncbi:hypothetical protein H632_c1036p1 [Helicosporidium sp. ATCC 50920]|nr:hypothetical protein H632_c1036p1 [Helicosporidium sp. ATCC 50920]|eukprot:KDD74847.1 hypothetical protein H632_c1036p1 [Helicosporidium sp. ATCC 50920]
MALLSHSLPQGLDAESLLSGNPDVAFTEDTEENGELDNAFKREQKLQADPTSMAMERFVENELAARLGRSAENDSKPDSSAPDVYVSDDFKRREEKEANAAWISGIAEVPLSVEERIRNVEATELAKKKMLAEAGLAIEANARARAHHAAQRAKKRAEDHPNW